ncbi:hypothetical protein [Geobacter sp.]|uniref:hypothetical protein n=1 Tax=Geobacter sp. TaxID=46610 RepID=UPI0026026093|nr:hypothetical protein [Geobacter sp.]
MRPSCPRCGGLMLPEYDHDDRVEAVKCLACGNRLWRQFTRRTASELERDTRCGRPAHQRI